MPAATDRRPLGQRFIPSLRFFGLPRLRDRGIHLAQPGPHCPRALEQRGFVGIKPDGRVEQLDLPHQIGFFAHLPAEQYRLPLALGREVEQAEIEILQLDAELLEPLHARDGGVGEPHELRLRRVQVARGVAAAVAADRGHELPLGPLQLPHPCAHGDEAFRGGSHLAQGVVSLVGSERPLGHRAAS